MTTPNQHELVAAASDDLFNQNELVGVCSDDLLQPARTAGCG